VCPSCGVKKSNCVPENISPLYEEGTYTKSDDREFIRFLKRHLHRIEARRLSKAAVSETFCDIGCGNGDFSRYLYEIGHNIVTADATSKRPRDIEGFPEIPYIHFDYSTVTLSNPGILEDRTIILRHVLEHVKDPQKMLQILSNQGASYFYIITPNSSSLSKKVFGKFEGLWGLPYHLWHFNKKSLETLCESAGLKVMQSGYETIPVFLYSFYRFLEARKTHKFILKIFNPDSIRLLLSFPMDILSINNVVYVIAKVTPMTQANKSSVT
jgi:hypothetical protein